MSSVLILGNGTMGHAITDFLARTPVQTTMVGRGEHWDASAFDAVLLALPFTAHDHIGRDHADALAGKIVIDISNPVTFDPLSRVRLPGGSASAALARSLPASRIVKAFNTNFARHLTAGSVGGLPLTVLVASDDRGAASFVVDVARGAGARSLDVGPLDRAEELEGLCYLQMSVTFADPGSPSGGFVFVK